MDRKQSILIYERREVFVLVLLGLALILFALTYGIHLGKNSESAHQPEVTEEEVAKAHAPAKRAAEPEPDRHDLSEEAKLSPEASDETMDDALKEAVSETGAHVTVTRQVDLPEGSKNPAAGATKAHAHGETHASVPPAPTHVQYSLQVGSFATQDEADSLFRTLKSHGLKAEILETEVAGKGTRHRVLLGTYGSKKQAQEVAEGYKAKGWISAFLVVEAEPR